MQVRMRYIDDGEAQPFTEIHFDELEELIHFIKRSGGVEAKGGTQPFHSYQIVCDKDGAYVEIIIGNED